MDGMMSSILNDVNIITQSTLEELLVKWHSMYTVNDEIKNQRLNQFVAHLKDFYEEMLLSEERRKNFYLKEVESKLKECRDLQKALDVSINCDVDCSETPLTEVIKHLDTSLKSFEELKNERISLLESLRAKENALCKLLGCKDIQLSDGFPGREDIEQLEHHLFILEEEKIKRTEIFNMYRESIDQYINKLEISNPDEFEKTLLDSDYIYSLTTYDLDKIKHLESSYKQRYESAKAKQEYMSDELNKLWKRLDVEEDYRTDFMNKYSGVGQKSLENIQREIHRCEKLKRELIEPLMKKTRSQILEMCDRLCFSENERSQYLSYDKNLCSEDLLDLLELELGKLEYIYSENCAILELANKHKDMWARMLELEEAAKDKNRLFNNRGGQLLREEKERKTIEQSLPKLHKKLEEMLLEYEQTKNTQFLFYGENLLLRIRNDLEQRNINMQNNKQIKKIESKQVPGSASKLREKRKCNDVITPRGETGKRLKLASSTTPLMSSKSSNKSVDGRSGSRSRIALFKDQDTSVASSYSIFHEEIEEKKRSTTMCVNPERQPLKDVNSPVLVFHSSPSHEEVNTPRFNFRPRNNQSITSAAKNAPAVKSTIPTLVNKKTPKQTTATPSIKITFATPKNVYKSGGRVATPKYVNSSSRPTPTHKNTLRTGRFFDTPISKNASNQKPLSVLTPAKFKFNF